ncbi:hypothetical protein [Nitrospira moscoviensis]|jgi:hypothetical protein|uniref:DM13 domain-containing protein n=1 Tax=Nitrospira moscoviensis TaxID=42253 RepID=A0A0K2GII5_NITMO|nr:hypothetical protein [Nitrospira moscoviensis]ALA60407.1 exported protein of unknown function [Nitrospira moscoviensis]
MSAKTAFRMGILSMVTAAGLFAASNGFAADAHTTAKFEGVKANSGTAMHGRSGNNDTLTWSDDFKIPDTPAPHWQVVDTKGNVFLLQRLKIKGDKENRTITLPPYVHDVAKVQIYCAWAEALLGEAAFAKPIMTASGEHANGMKADSGMKHDSMAMGR